MFASRLKIARKKCGFSQDKLAASAGISKQAVSKYERGRMMPSSDVLLRLGRKLAVSIEYLMGGQLAALEAVEFRKSAGTTAKDRALAEVLVTEVIEDYAVIEAILERKLPAGSVSQIRGNASSFAEAEKYAVGLRDHWQLGNDPIPSMARLLEYKGFKLVQTELPDSIHALTCNARMADGSIDNQIILMCKTGTVERRRFNLAHELGHKVILGGSGTHSPKLEKLVDCFAGAFLVPTEHLQQLAACNRHGISYGELVRLKHVYGVSATAMLMRLRQTGILPDQYIANLFRNRRVRQWRQQEPEPVADGRFHEMPKLFELMVWQALSEKLLAPVKAARMLKKPLAEIEQQLAALSS